MIIALASQFHIYLAWINAHQHSVLNVKALVGAFNQEKALCKFEVSRKFLLFWIQ